MSATKRKIRELALQLLFLWDSHGERDEAMTERAVKDGSSDSALRAHAIALAGGAWEHRKVTDECIVRIAPQWPPRRQPGVDRSLLRLAAWELMGTDTPPKVVIDEAIEIAKIYSTENSPAFVNGILDAILREKQQLTSGGN